jgi:hypothetical protein
MYLWIIALWRITMNRTLKSSIAIFKQEFNLQFITAGFFFAFFLISMLWTKYNYSNENGLPKLFIVFYTATFGFALPWQTNTKGHIVPEYGRYNLSLPVHSWQLYFLPLFSRLLLLVGFVAFATLLHGALYGFLNGRYIDLENILYYLKVSVLVYLILQTFAWTKDSFKNLFLWLGIALAVCVFRIPEILIRVFDNDYIEVYYSCTAILLILAAAGLLNLRKGLIFELPGLKSIADLFSKFGKTKEKVFSSPEKAHFYHLWKHSWIIMPGMMTGVIIITHIIAIKAGGSYSFLRDLLSIFTVFAVTTLAAPLIGIIFGNKCFKSNYIDNMPISSRSLAKVKLKCFCLSYAISLGIFLLWILCKLFVDGKLLQAINASNQIILHSSGVIIWIFAAFIIWAFILAFIVVSAVSKNRIFTSLLFITTLGYLLFPRQFMKAISPSGGLIELIIVIFAVLFYIFLNYKFPKANKFYMIIFMIPITMFGYFLCNLQTLKQFFYQFFYQHLHTTIPFYVTTPFYIILFCALSVLISGKLFMEWRNIKKSAIEFIAFIIISILAVLYMLIACKYTYLLFMPLVLLFTYPLTAFTSDIQMKRHEIDSKKLILSWPLILIVVLIFFGFFMYTHLLNWNQKIELNKVVKQCAAVTAEAPISIPRVTQKREEYIRQNMPYRKKLLPELSKYIKKEYSKHKRNNGGKVFNHNYVPGFIRKTIIQMLKKREYEQVLELTLFNIKTGIKYNNHQSQYLYHQIYKIPANKKSLLPKLQEIKQLLRKFLNRKLYTNVQTLNRRVISLAKNNIQYGCFTFNKGVVHYSHRYLNNAATFPEFDQQFLSPLCLSDSINFAQTLLEAIKCMNYCRTGKNKPDLTKKVNTAFISAYTTYSNINTTRNSLIAIAATQYRINNGKLPTSLQQLVPDYLKQNELYIINSGWWYSRHRQPNNFKPILMLMNMKKIKAYTLYYVR